MAHVQKRQTKRGVTYIVKWREPNGKHRTKGGFATKRAADAYATKAENAGLQGLTFDPNAGNVLFRDVAANWLESRADLKAAPNDGSRRHSRLAALRIDEVFGSYRINRIGREETQTWVGRMRSAGKKPSTIRNAYSVVRMVLGHAVQDGMLPANPADYVKLATDHNSGTAATVDDPAQFLTAAQVEALTAATPCRTTCWCI